jgi:hypothetical protein
LERYETVSHRYVLGDPRLLKEPPFTRRPLMLTIRVSMACLSCRISAR